VSVALGYRQRSKSTTRGHRRPHPRPAVQGAGPENVGADGRGGERYLASDTVRGIGRVYAKKLVRGFREAVFDTTACRSACARRAGSARSEGSASSMPWLGQKVISGIMVPLHCHGVGTAGAVPVFKTYGERHRRPARIENTGLILVRAGSGCALSEAMDEGHCGLLAPERAGAARAQAVRSPVRRQPVSPSSGRRYVPSNLSQKKSMTAKLLSACR